MILRLSAASSWARRRGSGSARIACVSGCSVTEASSSSPVTAFSTSSMTSWRLLPNTA